MGKTWPIKGIQATVTKMMGLFHIDDPEKTTLVVKVAVTDTNGNTAPAIFLMRKGLALNMARDLNVGSRLAALDFQILSMASRDRGSEDRYAPWACVSRCLTYGKSTVNYEPVDMEKVMATKMYGNAPVIFAAVPGVDMIH